MKSLLFILMLIFGTVALGQSPKKRNQKLRAELLMEQHRQDSVSRIFVQSGNRLNQLKLLSAEKSDQLTRKLKTVHQTQSSIQELFRALNYLDQHPDTSGMKNYLNLSDPEDWIKPMKELVKQIEPAEDAPDSLHLDGLKRKQQNELLKTKIAEYRQVLLENTLRLQRNEKREEQLNLFVANLDSLLSMYQDANKVLLSGQRTLGKQWKLLRENYRLKGPKGFPETYQKAFPDIHPVPRTPRNEFEPETPVAELFNISVPLDEEIYRFVDEPASFPGGRSGLMQYLAENIRYPESALDKGIEGKVYLKFVVSERGYISDIKVTKGVRDCPECDQEAVRVMKEMPKWIPAKMNGEPVSSYFNLPITYRIY